MTAIAKAYFVEFQTPTPIYIQNFYIGEDYVYAGKTWRFCPFTFSGITSNSTGDNGNKQLLLPSVAIILQYLTAHDGFRNTLIKVTETWLDNDLLPDPNIEIDGIYIGLGCSFGFTSIEVRMSNPLDAVTAQIPARKLSFDLVGILPTNSQVSLN